MDDPVITLHELSKTFNGAKRPAIDGLDGAIRPGLITGLVGPDGAGKTTLIRLMAGLLKPSSGSLRVLGLDPVAENDRLRHIIGYMPQSFGLYEDLTVGENLRLYADLRGVTGEDREKRFERLLEFTSLGPFTKRLAGKLSGGMKQKLGLACALLGSPQLLLLDEPGVGVDPISRRELWRMVLELVEGGIAVVWSTAYLDEAALCDEVIVLTEGRLLFDGPPAELTERVDGRCFQISGFPDSARHVLDKVRRLDGVVDGSIQGRAVRLVSGAPGVAARLEEAAAKLGASCRPVRPRFEDAVIDALGGTHRGESTIAARLGRVENGGGNVVEAEHLTKTFGTFNATDDVSFAVEPGEIFGLLGPNGAGKSTTFKMLCGLLKPSGGSARVMGQELHHGSHTRERLGYMAQKFSLYGNLSVNQNLAFFSGAYGLRGKGQREAVERVVEAFDLEPYLGSPAGKLPLGYKQRLALACALMHKPDVLFLDEPTSGVDPVTRREFWTHINGLVEHGVTIVVTTHFMEEAEYCDRIGLILGGRLIAIGSPDELRQQAATPQRPDPTMEDAFIHLVTTNREAADG